MDGDAENRFCEFVWRKPPIRASWQGREALNSRARRPAAQLRFAIKQESLQHGYS